MSQDPDEDLIEATIRRVAASKAARLPDLEEASSDAAEGESAGAPDLHIVPPTEKRAKPSAPSARPAADENLIEATLRRIEAQQAARAAEAAGGDDEPAKEAAVEPAPPPDIHLVRSEDDRPIEAAPARAGTAAPGKSNLAVAREPEFEAVPDSADASEVAALRRDLDEMRRQLRELSARVDSLFAGSEQPRATNGRSAPVQFSGASLPSKPKAADDDWEDKPIVAPMNTGLPPRPAVIRDPAPALAPPAPVDEAKPATPPTAGDAPKKGFDLLPRTYRITVEDKRRGVDLVPLHRALLGMEGVRDMSLLSYSNGTAIVALEAVMELSPDVLGAAVAHAMAREVKVEVHNEQTMVVKLAED